MATNWISLIKKSITQENKAFALINSIKRYTDQKVKYGTLNFAAASNSVLQNSKLSQFLPDSHQQDLKI